MESIYFIIIGCSVLILVILTILVVRYFINRRADGYFELPDQINNTVSKQSNNLPSTLNAPIVESRVETSSLLSGQIRIITNYCRSAKKEKVLLDTLDSINHRKCKFYSIIKDKPVDSSSSQISHMVTLINIDESSFTKTSRDSRLLNLIQFKSAVSVLRKCLMSLSHPYILPTLEVSVKSNSGTVHVFLVREFSPIGSIKDLIHNTSPQDKRGYSDKFNLKHGKPLPTSLIIKYSAQIIEACMFVEKFEFPYFHLHSGNVLIDKNDNVKLTDYENSFLGCTSMYHSIFQRMNISNNQSVDIMAFGCLIYEMATGKPVEYPIPDISFSNEKIYNVLNLIFRDSKKYKVTWELILKMPLYENNLEDFKINVQLPNLEEIPRSVLNSTLLFFTEAYTNDLSVPEKKKKSKKNKTKIDPEEISITISSSPARQPSLINAMKTNTDYNITRYQKNIAAESNASLKSSPISSQEEDDSFFFGNGAEEEDSITRYIKNKVKRQQSNIFKDLED